MDCCCSVLDLLLRCAFHGLKEKGIKNIKIYGEPLGVEGGGTRVVAAGGARRFFLPTTECAVVLDGLFCARPLAPTERLTINPGSWSAANAATGVLCVVVLLASAC